MANINPTKLESLMLFVLRYLDRELGKIEFAKIVYLIDVEAIELLGKPIASGSYSRQEHGPLVDAFYDALRNMTGNEITLERKNSLGFSSWGKHSIRLGRSVRFDPLLTAEEIALAQRVLDRIGNLSPRQLEKLAYKTSPMQKILELEKQINQIALGASLNMSVIQMDDVLERHRRNVAALPEDKEYAAYMARQRKETAEFMAAEG